MSELDLLRKIADLEARLARLESAGAPYTTTSAGAMTTPALTVGGVLTAGASAGVAKSIDLYGGAAGTRFQPSLTSLRTISGMTELGDLILKETSGVSVCSLDWYADGNGVTRNSKLLISVRVNGLERSLTLDGATGAVTWPGGVNIGAGTSAADGVLSMAEVTAPSAPAANGVYIYVEDNGAGKTRLMALFSSGAAQQLAIQP